MKIGCAYNKWDVLLNEEPRRWHDCQNAGKECNLDISTLICYSPQPLPNQILGAENTKKTQKQNCLFIFTY